jgi:Sulfotransferase family
MTADTPAPRRDGPVPILFVGGTGRSGTHVVAKLAARNSNYRLVPVETRFHTDSEGFPGLLAGEVTKRAFIRRMRGFWWRGFQTDRLRGLYRFVPRERFDQALTAFDERFDGDPEGACRTLFLELLWPVTSEGRRPGAAAGIVEQSCDVIAQAPTLVKLFPEARFVHVVRDGRDASASRVSQRRWLVYPRTRKQGLEWWETRIRAIDAGARAIEPDRLLELGLDDFLVRGARRRAVEQLAAFAGVGPGMRMRHFMRRRMNPAQANRERWRRGLSPDQQREVARAYREILDELERDGVSCVPILRRALERDADAGSERAAA